MLTSYVGGLYIPVNVLTASRIHMEKWVDQSFHAVPSERYPSNDINGPSGLRALSTDNYYARLGINNTLRGHPVELLMGGTWDAVRMRFVRDPEDNGPLGGIVYEKGNANPLDRVPGITCPLVIAKEASIYGEMKYLYVRPGLGAPASHSPQTIAHWYTIFIRMFTTDVAKAPFPIRGRVAWVDSDEASGFLRYHQVGGIVRVYTHPRFDHDREETPT